ncbi:MAG: glycosyltransferase family 4 protein [Candidatus Omnitrophica bacterium]|nr:glycosyltransferase family 4 protein [Candidatus Omnitrophota bacterium]
MNILLISTHLNVGGITTYLLGLCRYYLKKGHRVVLVTSGGVRADEFAQAGVILVTAAVRTKAELNPRIYCDVPRLLKVMRDHRIDIIHSHTRVTQFLGRVLGILSGVPYVSTCHGFYKTHWFRKAFPCWGEAVVAISPPVREHLVNDFHTPEDRIFLVQNGVDVDSFTVVDEQIRRKAREKFQVPNDPVIGMVARLADVKGHSVLIDAMPLIVKEFPGVLLFIAGEGKMEAQLKEQAARLGLNDHVKFAEVFNSSGEILSLFDVFVMPSIDEGFGLSGMEAQAAGLPVAASDVGGIPSFIFHERTGLLVPVKDPVALAAAILRFLKDRPFAHQIGKQAREFIEKNFSSDITAEKTLEMYAKVLSARAAGGSNS